MITAVYVKEDNDSVNVTGDYTGTVGRFSPLWVELGLSELEDAGLIQEYQEPVVEEPVVEEPVDDVVDTSLGLTVAWFNHKQHAVRVIGGYKMIPQKDPMWLELRIQEYIDKGLVLAHDFDKVVVPPPTEEELLAAEADKERYWRNGELEAVDCLVNIAIDRGEPTAELSAYRESLRNYPVDVDFPRGNRPTNSHKPT